ncbi:MAG: GGDEF domain-containing protein [Pseudomonadota bacterium]
MKAPSKNILTQLISGVREPVMVVTRARNADRVTYFNPALLHLLDMTSGDVSNQDAEVLLNKLGGSAATDALDRCNSETPQVRFDATYVSATGPDQRISGEIVAAAGHSNVCIVYLRASEIEASATSTADSGQQRQLELTGSFIASDPWMDLFQRDVAIAAREHVWLAVIVFKVDAFAAYVDTFGQHAGDSAMKRISHSIRRRLKRAGDSASRLGDDEIAVIAHGSTAPAVREFAHSIATDIRALAIHHPKSPFGRHITVSIGVCGEVPDVKNGAADRMLARAREAISRPIDLAEVSTPLIAH